MKLLLDAHLLLWVAFGPEKLSLAALQAVEDPQNQLLFSTASLWEVAIKRALGRSDFIADPRLLRRGLLDSITGAHVVAVDDLPGIHKVPFDRILIAQSVFERSSLLTVDDLVAQYPAPIIRA